MARPSRKYNLFCEKKKCDSVTQFALIPTAYSLGTEFKNSLHKPVDGIAHVDRWSVEDENRTNKVPTSRRVDVIRRGMMVTIECTVPICADAISGTASTAAHSVAAADALVFLLRSLGQRGLGGDQLARDRRIYRTWNNSCSAPRPGLRSTLDARLPLWITRFALAIRARIAA